MSTNNSTFNTIIGILGIAGLSYGLAMRTKMAKVSERLDRSIDSLAGDMEIDIPEEMVNKAIERAVATAAKNAATTAVNNALGEIKRDIHSKVSTAVENEYYAIKDKVLAEATVAASKINVDRVRRDVEKAAEKMALEKFDANLDGIVKKFTDNLDNSAKIYSAIQSVLNPATATPTPVNTGREFVVRVG